ncbi:SLC13 family permease [Mesorhizobium sp. YIM 152430]|uniref:SLC13 family permease n=1 Tax=Mesorhizobium sp. YIM 152430 TaxID=3031761 RepID=UPI0023DC5A99|nr:SLC13 family permease [Mesorhizobium sp. YIM 152430]MDF1598222.1 SLC13 family permease [Mesorhizobium sp. YIM 152430]
MTAISLSLTRPTFAAGFRAWLAAAASVAIAWLAIALFLSDLAFEGRATLAIFAAMMAGWLILKLPETPVAITAFLALAATGAADQDDLFDTFDNEIIWLLIAAFILAAIIKRTGLAERHATSAIGRFRTVPAMFTAATLIIFATAFFIPSTSARAAILLPVFAALSAAIGRPGVTKGLALLFPSVILLSAGASLTGAGAHLIALGFIDEIDGPKISYLDWAMLGAPFALAMSLAANFAIQRLFLTPEDKAPLARAIAAPVEPRAGDRRLTAIIVATVALWATGGWHGIDLALIALGAALLAATKAVSGIAFKDALKDVDWNLLFFLAATLVVGEALLETGAAAFLVDRLVGSLDMALSPALTIAIAAVVAALAHLVIISRTARAAVLIPALALPLWRFGTDPTTLIFVVTIASGFCQTLMVSAKPVMLFGQAEGHPFSQGDLLRLALWLLPVFVAGLLFFALVVWPMQGLAG